MDPRTCVERLLAAIRENDASEMVQASADLLNLLIGIEGMLATPGERERIQLALAQVADACEGIPQVHQGSVCADCGSDNCCGKFTEGMES